MEEIGTSSTQPTNPVKDTSAHLTGTDYMQKKWAEQHWFAVGTEDLGIASNVERAVVDGVLFKVAVSVTGRQIIGLIDLGASRCYMSPETAAICELQLYPEALNLEIADGSKGQSMQKAKNVSIVVGKSI